MILLGEEEL